MVIKRFLRIAIALLVLLGAAYGFRTIVGDCSGPWTGPSRFIKDLDGRVKFNNTLISPKPIQIVGGYALYHRVAHIGGFPPSGLMYYQFWNTRQWVNGYNSARAFDPKSTFVGSKKLVLIDSYLPAKMPLSGTPMTMHYWVYYDCHYDGTEVACNGCGLWQDISAP